MASSLFATKSIDALRADAAENRGLKRALGAMDLMLLGVGAIIGTGIFVLTGQAAADNAGPAVVLSFVAAGIASGFAGLCYSEMASMIPIAGSAYTYSYATMGELVAWIIGWDLILEYMVASAAVSVGWSGYAVAFVHDVLGVTLSPTWTRAHFVYDEVLGQFHSTGAVLNIPAMLITALVTAILVIGIKESAHFNNIIVAAKLAVLFIFVGIGGWTLMHHPEMRAANWHPFLPPNLGHFGQFGWSGALRGAGVIFFAYIGFDAVSTAAQEAKNPKRDMPIGLLGSLAVCTVLYILVAVVLTGLVNYHYLNVPDSLAVGMDQTGVRWGSMLVKIGALGGLTSTMIVMLLGQSRVFFSMSKDGLLPEFFSRVHPKFRTPWISSITVGLVVATFGSLIPLASLGEMTSIGTLLAFIIVCAGILVLRKRRPDLPRPFRAPWMPFTPIAGIVVSLAMMLGLPWMTWVRLFVWLAVGLVIYFTYSRHHSKCQQPPC